MLTIEYRATYGEGGQETISVRARSVNSGFQKALREARKPLANGHVRVLNRIEFMQVREF